MLVCVQENVNGGMNAFNIRYETNLKPRMGAINQKNEQGIYLNLK